MTRGKIISALILTSLIYQSNVLVLAGLSLSNSASTADLTDLDTNFVKLAIRASWSCSGTGVGLGTPGKRQVLTMCDDGSCGAKADSSSEFPLTDNHPMAQWEDGFNSPDTATELAVSLASQAQDKFANSLIDNFLSGPAANTPSWSSTDAPFSPNIAEGTTAEFEVAAVADKIAPTIQQDPETGYVALGQSFG